MLWTLFSGNGSLRYPLLYENRTGRDGQDLSPGGRTPERKAEEWNGICTEGIPEGLQPPAWQEEPRDHLRGRVEPAGGGGTGAESAGYSGKYR